MKTTDGNWVTIGRTGIRPWHKLKPGLVDLLLRECWQDQLRDLRSRVVVYLDMDQSPDDRTIFVRVVARYPDGAKLELNQIDLRSLENPVLDLKEFAEVVKNQLQLML